MEKAMRINNILQLDKKQLTGIDRVYIGEEFCERLLPSEEELKSVIEKIEGMNKRISFLTPPSTDYGLVKIRKLMKLLNEKTEVIVNDYGILNMVNKDFENPIVLGRVIGRRIILTLASLESNIENLREYLSLFGRRLKLIETDYLTASYVNNSLGKSIDFSLYETNVFWSMTRRCAFNRNSVTLNKFAECSRECRKNKAVIINKKADREFLLEGNKILDLKAPSFKKINLSLFRRVVYF